MKCLTLVFSFLFLVKLPTYSQVSLQACEAAFRQNNLLLLAEQYNIDAAKAAVIQSRIWELPYLSGEFNAVNPQDRRVLDVGGRGQKGLAIQQLIYLGGKKKNEIEFVKSNIVLAELQFEQLLLNLRYQLRQRFYSLYFNLRKIEGITAQASRLDTLIANYTVQVEKGNLPLKDLVRLQSLQLNLRNELISLQGETIQEQNELNLLTGLTPPVIPLVSSQDLEIHYQKPVKFSPEELLTMVLENNLEYLSYLKVRESNELFLKWQESLATPDLSAGLSYDQRGGAFGNQVNVTVGIPLPLWNRNRGNIKIAEAQLAKSNLEKDYKLQEFRSQTLTAYQLWEQYFRQYRQYYTNLVDLTEVYNAMILNFQRRNISIMEFTDFMESYNLSMLQINEMRKQLILSGESLNYLANTTVF